jgi:hypothetical protein
VAKCSSSGFLRTAKLKVNWEMKSLSELKPLYDKVMGFLLNSEYGEYLAMKEIFGEAMAIRVAMKGDMKLPAFVTSEQKRTVIQNF